MIEFPNGFAAATQKLTPELLGEAGAPAVQQLSERGYEVHVGLTPELADAIAVMAREASILEFCPKDSSERFTDRAAAERWLSKKRSMFLLLKRSGDNSLNLAGYGWSGAGSSAHVPGGQTTFAIRIGEAGQGQGLATPFSQLIVIGSAILYGAKNLWLETWQVNAGAVHVYHKIGFVTVDEKPDERLVPDGTRVPDTRLYMSLPNELLPPPRT
jgi:hypothetical protein